jgi:hypothetical protein
MPQNSLGRTFLRLAAGMIVVYLPFASVGGLLLIGAVRTPEAGS